MGRLLGRLFVAFTLFLITFIGYSSQIFVIWPWYGRELSVDLITLLAPFNILLFMLLWNYYLCVITDPGQVPKAWKPDFEDVEGYEVKKLTRRPRYCRTCEVYKPPRAHHCSQCKRCVLRMDHHCPWVNNCVGHFNYGHFVRFLFYVDVACAYHIIMVSKRCFGVKSSFWDEPSGLELIFIILNYVFCAPVLLAVGGFSIYHFLALLNNTTTIEGWEKDKAATLVRRGKIQEIKFPYNLGRRRNIESVLGDSPLFWCWPTVPPGNGLKYPVAEGQDDDAAEAWPPKDPNPYPYLTEPDPDYKFKLPDSPWTYENGSFNPDLQPASGYKPGTSSSTTRRRTPRKERIARVPPWHPDYKPPGEDENSDSPPYAGESEDEDVESGMGHRRLVRRGSEGYEVYAINREEMLRQHVVEHIHEPGRYNVYVPDPESESEEERDEQVPLAKKVEDWRAETAAA